MSRVYNDNFWIASESIGGGTTVAFTYDNDGLLDKAGALTLNRTPINGLITGTTLGATSDACTYNSFGELTGYTASDKGTAVYHVALTRDNLGRIATESETIGGKTTAYGYNYDASGRLFSVLDNGQIAISYTYDSNSNRLTATAGTVTTKGTYDAQDRLLSYGSASYTYTANGELASKSVGALKTTYKYGVIYRMFSDHLGSPRLVINAVTGQIAEQINYDAFGNVITDTNPGFQPFGFAGGLYDQDTKLIRFGARDYDRGVRIPELGRPRDPAERLRMKLAI